MKPGTIKKIAFAVLLLIAGYIWWGNLRSFQSSVAPGLPEQQAAADTADPTAKNRAAIAYVEPKVNPFLNKARADASQPPQPPVSRTQRPGPRNTPPSPSTRCTLKGLVRESETPQVVVVFEDLTSAVLSVGDSLGTWQLIAIRDSLAVFKLEKAYDTLWLDGKRP